MDCRQTRESIEDLLDGQLAADAAAEVRSHLEHCAGCRAVVGREQTLREALRSLPAAFPPPGFVDRALRRATARHRSHEPRSYWRPTFALAATLVAGIAIGLFLAGPGAPVIDSAPDTPMVSLTLEQPRDIQLAFDSELPLDGVLVTLYLPDQVEIDGFPGQRSIQWHTDLAAGRNRLPLPVVALGGEGGVLIAELVHGQRVKRFVIRLEVGNATAGSPSAPLLMTT